MTCGRVDLTSNSVNALYTSGTCSNMWSEADKIWLQQVLATRKGHLTRHNLDAEETEISSLTAKLENAGIKTRECLVTAMSQWTKTRSWNFKMLSAGIHEVVINQIVLCVEF